MAIAKAQEAMYIDKQSQSESNIEYLQTFKNKAVVLEAVGGNLVNDGVKRYMVESLYNKEYNSCTVNHVSLFIRELIYLKLLIFQQH
jgi:hypothetical protein